MQNQDLMGILSAIKDTPVLVAGDIMLDRFIYGSVDRISPESPVPVLCVKREDSMLGGAGNALANLAGLNAKGYILSIIGDDKDGADIRSQIEDLGLNTEGLIVDETRSTIVKSRFLAGHQQLLRTDFEDKHPITDGMAKQILAKAEDLLKQVKAVVISDYGKGMLRADVLAGLIKLAKKNDVPVIVDPKGQDFSIYKGASVITPNKKELSEATQGMPVGNDEEVIAAAEKIIKGCSINAVLATRSAEGMSVIEKKSEPIHLRSADNVEVYDVSGAGDTVIATIASALAAGQSLEAAAALANVAGSIVVAKVGTAPIRAAELEERLSEDQSTRASIADWEEGAEQVKRWKARGLKVGFTNGCFDILHYGHVTYLQDARAHCDRLIVALNSDASVKVLKGPERPVHDENSRSAVLGGLGCVDMVVLFGAEKAGDDNTAIKLLETLKPDIYFKGGDYTVDQIPEAPTVQSYGGEVSVMPVYVGHSTTNSIKKMKDEAA